MTATVAVVGGGYGGIAVAKALDEIADVRLIEPRETFVGPETTARLKGADLMIPAYAQLLGLPEPAGQEAAR